MPAPGIKSKDINDASNVRQCVSVLNHVRLFREMITDPEAQKIIAATMDDLYLPIIKRLSDQDINGCLVAIRHLIEKLGSCDSVLEQLFKEVDIELAMVISPISYFDFRRSQFKDLLYQDAKM